MTEIMMGLGGYRFSMKTAAYEDLNRKTSYDWARQKRVGLAPALQFTGLGVDTISLSGMLYPHFAGGLDQIDQMRAEASGGAPLIMVDGMGNLLGKWVIMSISESHKRPTPYGAPRRINFSLELERYPDDV